MSLDTTGLSLMSIIWCSRCQVEKYRVYRKALSDGIFENVRDPEPERAFLYKCADCGGALGKI